MFAKKKGLHAALLAAGLLMASSNAAVFADNGQRGERRGPPQAAFDACHGKPAGASCDMQGPRGTMSGACRSTPSGVLCMPAHGPRAGRDDGRGGPPSQRMDGRRGPPQAAFDACRGKPAGASCEMQGPRGTMSGACREFNGQTACAPAMGGRGPGGPGPRPPQ